MSLRQINCGDKGTRGVLISGNINSDATGIDIIFQREVFWELTVRFKIIKKKPILEFYFW